MSLNEMRLEEIASQGRISSALSAIDNVTSKNPKVLDKARKVKAMLEELKRDHMEDIRRRFGAGNLGED